MAYNAVPTITTGDVATAAWGNTYIKDNFAAGVPDIFTTDGDMAVGTGANAAERVAVMNASNLLKHEVGGLEVSIAAVTTNDAVGGASCGVMEIKTPMTQGEAQAGCGTRFSLVSPLRLKEAIDSLGGAGTCQTNTWTQDQTYTDNTKITLGTHGDVDLYFNGANLVLNPQVAETGHIQICEADIGSTAANAGTLNLNSTDNGALGPIIVVRHFSDSPADGDNNFTMAFRMQDDFSSPGPRDVLGAQIQIRTLDYTHGSFNTEMRFGITCGSAGDPWINFTGTLTGNGVWTDASAGADKLYEGDATSVWGARVIDLLPDLNIGQYRNVSRPVCNPGPRHVSPTAEDLWDLFHLGHDPASPITTTGIAAKDLGGLALMAAQELIGEIAEIKRHLGI